MPTSPSDSKPPFRRAAIRGALGAILLLVLPHRAVAGQALSPAPDPVRLTAARGADREVFEAYTAAAYRLPEGPRQQAPLLNAQPGSPRAPRAMSTLAPAHPAAWRFGGHRADAALASGTARTDRRRRRTIIGAVVGATVGAALSTVVLHAGGSTAKCDRGANQDALRAGECAGLITLGAALGGGVGAVIGSR